MTIIDQYTAAKKDHPDTILLFRSGDFYETFHDDARTLASSLGLVLTSMDKGKGSVPMCGFPYRQLSAYVAKLLTEGKRVAVLEPATKAPGKWINHCQTEI